MFGFAIDAYAQRFVQRTPQRNVQRGGQEMYTTPEANHVTFNNGRQATRQIKTENITVEITPQGRKDYHNAAGAFQRAANQLKQRYQ